MTLRKLLPGWYQLSDGVHFSNVRKGFGYDGEVQSKWYADIHRSSDGVLVRFAGIWDTRKAALDEAQYLIERM